MFHPLVTGRSHLWHHVVGYVLPGSMNTREDIY